jgi:hypothetical protein
MKRTALLAALFLSASLAATAQTASTATGTWALAYNVSGLSIKMTCAITQTGNALTGTCTGDDKVDHALTGGVKDQAVTFKFDKTLQGSQITDTFVSPGGVQAGTIKGTMSVAPIGVSGTFTATKQ